MWRAGDVLRLAAHGSLQNTCKMKMEFAMSLLCPLRDIPSGYCFFTGPWTVTPSSLCMLRRVAAFCRPLRPVFLLVSFSHWRGP